MRTSVEGGLGRAPQLAVAFEVSGTAALIDLDQLQLDSTALPDLLSAAERMNFTGLNITFGHNNAPAKKLDSNERQALKMLLALTMVEAVLMSPDLLNLPP